MLHAGIPASALDDVEDDEQGGHDPVVYRKTPEDDWHDAVYHDLGDIDRVIMQYRTGYRGYHVLSTNEIAKRLKVSPGLISQRARHIQSRLDEFDG
jgi:DNA-directed RNA polymerase specialized sigma subunit